MKINNFTVRRFEKKATVAGTTTLYQRYIYRGFLQIACLDLTRAGTPALWFVFWDPTQPTATRPLAIQKNGTWFVYGHDLTKNVMELFGPSGFIRNEYSYAPFGAVFATTDLSQPFQFSSEFYDSELALVYYNYRHYSPTLGRWLSRDPIEEQGGVNLYCFCGNNPILMWDNLGNWFGGIPILGTIETFVQVAINSFPGTKYIDYSNPCAGDAGKCMTVELCKIAIKDQKNSFFWALTTPNGVKIFIDTIIAILGNFHIAILTVSSIDALVGIAVNNWGAKKISKAGEEAADVFCNKYNCKGGR